MTQAFAEKLEHTGPAEKEQSRMSKVTDREVRESQGEREPHLSGREGDQSESMETKGWTPSEGRQVPRRKNKGKARKQSLPSRKKHEVMSGRESSPGRSAESRFHSKSGQI